MKLRAALGIVLTALWLAPLNAVAGSLRSDVLSLLPAESGEVAFLDLQALRGSPHYSLIKQRLLPPRLSNFEQFMRSLGVDADQELEWLAWAYVPPGPEHPDELFMVLAQGEFVPEKMEQGFLQKKLSLDTYRGQTLFPFARSTGGQDLFFTFLDSSTAAFGTRPSLELLLDTRYGAHQNLLYNDTLLAHLNEVNGHAPVWAVLDDYYTRVAVHQLLPEAGKFEEFTRVADRLRSSILRLNLDKEMTLSFQAWCAEPLDAQVFSLLLQTGLAAQSWIVRESNPALSSILGHMRVNTAGERLELRVAMEERELRALLELPPLP